MSILPVNPEKILFKFPTRTCGFDSTKIIPPDYTLTQTTSLPAVNIGTQTFQESALALFTPATSTTDPTNKAALQALIKQWSSDYLNWRQTQFDIVMAGIVNVAPTALIQVTEFDYNYDKCVTRISTLPDNFPPDRLAHQLATLETDCSNKTELNTAEPCFKGYGPPIENQAANTTTLDEYLLCMQDGRLVETWLQKVTYPCGCGPPTICCQAPCAPCDIPRKDMSLSVYCPVTIDGPITVNTTLSYDFASNSWISPCVMLPTNAGSGRPPVLVSLPVSFVFRACNSFVFRLWGGTTQCSGTVQNFEIDVDPCQVTTKTCNPTSFKYDYTGTTCPGGGLTGFFPFLVFTLTCPSVDPTMLMCQTFHVVGCNNLSYPNLTVSVIEGDVRIAIGVTDANGNVFLSWNGVPGIYIVNVTGQDPRGLPFAMNEDLECDGTTNITILPAHHYACSTCCPQALAEILFLNDSVYGLVVLLYNGSNWIGMQLAPVVVAACNPCPGFTYMAGVAPDVPPIQYIWNCNLISKWLIADVDGGPTPAGCPGTFGNDGDNFASCTYNHTSLSCPNGGNDFNWVSNGVPMSCENPVPPPPAIPEAAIYCSGVRFTVTER